MRTSVMASWPSSALPAQIQTSTSRRIGRTTSTGTLVGLRLEHSLNSLHRRKLLYGLFLSGDGNFQLVRRNNRSGESVQDSLLADGAFWVQEQKFDDHLEASKTRPEDKVSTSEGSTPLRDGTSPRAPMNTSHT